MGGGRARGERRAEAGRRSRGRPAFASPSVPKGGQGARAPPTAGAGAGFRPGTVGLAARRRRCGAALPAGRARARGAGAARRARAAALHAPGKRGTGAGRRKKNPNGEALRAKFKTTTIIIRYLKKKKKVIREKKKKLLSKNSQSFGRSFRARLRVGPRSARSLAVVLANGSGRWRGFGKGRGPAPRSRPASWRWPRPRELSGVPRALLGGAESRARGRSGGRRPSSDFCCAEPAPDVQSRSQRSWGRSRGGNRGSRTRIAGAKLASRNALAAPQFPFSLLHSGLFFFFKIGPLSRESASNTRLHLLRAPAPRRQP